MPEVFGEVGSGEEFYLAAFQIWLYRHSCAWLRHYKKLLVIMAEWLLIQGVAEPSD